jgi:chromosome segregation ATPase
MQDVTSSLVSKFVFEIGEMQNQLIELDKIKVELEEELGQLKCVEEESRVVKASLEEQLTNSNAENKFLSENLKHEINERKRVEEESRVVKASLEEQLTNSNAENKFLSENLKHEINERKRVEEEFHAVKASLEEQLAKRESEMDVLMKNLENEREAFNQTLGNLQKQFDTWLNKIFEGRNSL